MIKLGELQTLTAVQFEKQGVYLTDGSGEKVLLPSNQFDKKLQKNDEVEVFIYKDSEDRLIATKQTPYITLHKTALLTVKEVTSIGAFLDWGLAKDLLLPFKEQTFKVKEGDSVLVALYIDKSSRLCATMEVYDYLKTDGSFQKDQRVTGYVYQVIDNFGAFIAVDNRYSGMIPKKDLHHVPAIGEIVSVRITDILPDGKLNLSFHEKACIQMDADAELIFECLETAGGFLPYHDKTSPEIISREFDMSKAAFKRAIGSLYKNKKIMIKENGIRLLTQEEKDEAEAQLRKQKKEEKHRAAVRKYEPIYGRKH